MKLGKKVGKHETLEVSLVSESKLVSMWGSSSYASNVSVRS